MTEMVIAGFAAHIATAVGANNVVELDGHRRRQRSIQPPST